MTVVVTPADEALLAAGHLVLDVLGPVATISLNRPDVRNAQTPATWVALAKIPELLGPEVRIVVVRGLGRSFSAGLDRSTWTDGTFARLAALPDDEADAWIARHQRAFSWLSGPDRITIAAVQGHAIGAGCQLALACDLIVATDDAEFALFEVKLGLVPDLGGIQRLVRAVGQARALELCVTGRPVPAAEARDIGLVHSVVPIAELTAAVRTLTDSVLSNPAPAVRAITQLIAAAASATPDEQLAHDRAAQLPLLREIAARPLGR